MPTFSIQKKIVWDHGPPFRARGAKKASKLETFKLDGLRRLRQAMTYSPVSRADARLLSDCVHYSSIHLHIFQILPTTHLPSAARMVDGMVKEVTAFLEANPNLPQDYEVTADDLGLKSGVAGSRSCLSI